MSASSADSAGWQPDILHFSSSARQKLLVVAIPVTLKAFGGIVLSLQVEKLFELRITCHDLPGFGEFMVGEVITSAASYRQINQAAKGPRRCFDACLSVEREQIEDHARIRFPGPSQEAFIVFFDEPNCAVDDSCMIRAQRFCRLR